MCKCGGRHWTPTTDGDVWAQQLYPVLISEAEKLKRQLSLLSTGMGWWHHGFFVFVSDYHRARAQGDKNGYLEAAWNALMVTGVEKETKL